MSILVAASEGNHQADTGRLYELAHKKSIPCRSKTGKSELIKAIRRAG